MESNMAARVIHFGIDDCYRLNVLRRAGYEISECSDTMKLCTALKRDQDAAAVIVNDCEGDLTAEAIAFARSQSPIPIVLFPNSKRSYDGMEFDLVVPTHTPPEEWLLDLANLIVKSRAIRACSQILQQQYDTQLRQATAGREKSRRRERPGQEVDAPANFASPFGADEEHTSE